MMTWSDWILEKASETYIALGEVQIANRQVGALDEDREVAPRPFRQILDLHPRHQQHTREHIPALEWWHKDSSHDSSRHVPVQE